MDAIYYFKQLPFGKKSAPNIFQKVMDQMFSGCPCDVGHVLTSEGVKADPEKIRAVVEMQTPDDAKSLRRFLMSHTYQSSFHS